MDSPAVLIDHRCIDLPPPHGFTAAALIDRRRGDKLQHIETAVQRGETAAVR